MVLAMYRVHSSMCMQGQMKEVLPIAYQPNHYRVKVLCFVESYLEVEDAEIESTVVNLNPRIDKVVYHETLRVGYARLEHR